MSIAIILRLPKRQSDTALHSFPTISWFGTMLAFNGVIGADIVLEPSPACGRGQGEGEPPSEAARLRSKVLAITAG